jgi:hypothetical protein
MKSTPPQARPARTLVLIFMVISWCVVSGMNQQRDRASDRELSGSDEDGATAAGANLGLDLHGDLLVRGERGERNEPATRPPSE